MFFFFLLINKNECGKCQFAVVVCLDKTRGARVKLKINESPGYGKNAEILLK